MEKKELIDLLDSVLRKLKQRTEPELIAAQGELKTVRYWIEKNYDNDQTNRSGGPAG